MYTNNDIFEYLSALSTMAIAVEMNYRKREIIAVIDNLLAKTTSSITHDLCRGIKKNKTPKAKIRELYREMKCKYKTRGYDWTTVGE